ncbi:hypothetical protein SBA6_1100018 [Candidatus Sulfopaludibacter sp. SbA6]|nr:hypothetical protein SBA6_1100018 [Candidatus Sulfopaludibacter sp. SbA6]
MPQESMSRRPKHPLRPEGRAAIVAGIERRWELQRTRREAALRASPSSQPRHETPRAQARGRGRNRLWSRFFEGANFAAPTHRIRAGGCVYSE